MNIRRVKLVWLALVALLFAISGDRASGQHLVEARILSVDGPVEIRRSPSSGAVLTKIKFRPADQLKAGDQIITGWRGRLVLGLTDGSQAVVAERSIVEVRDLGSSPRELFHVLRGKTRVYIEKLGGRPNPYRINTPTAVIAVRGTVFDVIVKSNETEVFVHEGAVAVSSLNEPEQLVLLSAGQMTRVRRDQPPTPAATFKPGRNNDSFRPAIESRPVADTFDLDDRRIVDRTFSTPRTATPIGRRDSNTPTTGGRAPARRP